MNSRIDPRDIHDGDWEVFEVTPEYRRSRLWLDDTKYIMRTEYLADEALQEQNRQAFDASLGKRFNDDYTNVASVPLNVLYDPKHQIAEKLREGDQDHLKWWLKRDEARPFKRFRGTF